MKAPILESDVIKMRRLEHDDIASIIEYASNIEIANNTFVPHPYPPEAAIEFVTITREQWNKDEGYVFALIEKQRGSFVGVMGLHPEPKNYLAEVGYWIGQPHWGKGYATYALRLLIQFAFERTDLNRVYARHFLTNPASGRVMEKAGMTYEGTSRQVVFHHEEFKDAALYAILKEDYHAQIRD
jgi:[ribosomal protein S5]-alanine N-acetyltransferase